MSSKRPGFQADAYQVEEQPETQNKATHKEYSRPWWSPQGTVPKAKYVYQIPRRIWQTLLSLVILSVFILSAVGTPGQQPTVRANGAIEAVPTLLDLSQGCTGVTAWPDAPEGENGWLPNGAEFTFLTNPPVVGNFAQNPWAGKKVSSENDTQLPHPAETLSLLYRGWIVIWYRTSLDATVVQQLEEWANSLPADNKVIVSPWPLEKNLPWRTDRRLIITGWRTTQACLTFDAKTIKAFDTKRVAAPGIYLGADEPGPKATVNTTERIRAAQN